MNAATMDSAGRDLPVFGEAPSPASSSSSSSRVPSSTSPKRRRGSMRIGNIRSTSPGRGVGGGVGLFRKSSSANGSSRSILSRTSSKNNIKGSGIISNGVSNERGRLKAMLSRTSKKSSALDKSKSMRGNEKKREPMKASTNRNASLTRSSFSSPVLVTAGDSAKATSTSESGDAFDMESASVSGAERRRSPRAQERSNGSSASTVIGTMTPSPVSFDSTRGRTRFHSSGVEQVPTRRRANSLEDARWQSNASTQDQDSLSTGRPSRRSNSVGSDGRPRSSMTVRTLEESLSKSSESRRDAARVRRSIRRMSSQERLDTAECGGSVRSGISTTAPPSVRSFYSKLERANSINRFTLNTDDSSCSNTQPRRALATHTSRPSLSDVASAASCSYMSPVNLNQDDELSVSFKNVEIREYPITIGDNPSVSTGPPITIGWEPQDEQVADIDEYESHRPIRRQSSEMAVPKVLREDIILNAGVSAEDLTKFTRDVTLLRRQRRRTVETLSNSQMDETIERTKRKLRNTFRKSSKKKEKDMIQKGILIDRKNEQYRNEQVISDEIEDSITLHEMEMAVAVEMDMLDKAGIPLHELAHNYSDTPSVSSPPTVICIDDDERGAPPRRPQ